MPSAIISEDILNTPERAKLSKARAMVAKCKAYGGDSSTVPMIPQHRGYDMKTCHPDLNPMLSYPTAYLRYENMSPGSKSNVVLSYCLFTI